ncbi:hypothetical protein FDX24_05690 [Citrobacter sp. wls716]|uniref:hypothetical protein n=1 Tax=Citrobacter sp. wls716 TaxID=2576420 RepID=UPI0010C97D84|nr:hypothetical protein [Citrobacter sp. wls716]TKU44048.1 hypothetical protein FDX24_05690 [Citrobacter sp. wls716]
MECDEMQLHRQQLRREASERHTLKQPPEIFQMLEVITNPILGGMIATFSIGMAFTIWSTVSDWMWDRKNK